MYYIKSLIYGSDTTEKDSVQIKQPVDETLHEYTEQTNDININTIETNVSKIKQHCLKQTENLYCMGLNENKHFQTMKGQCYTVQQSGLNDAEPMKFNFYETTIGDDYAIQQRGSENIVPLKTNYYTSSH